MINFGINITNPFSTRFENRAVWHGKLSKNFAWEVELLRTNTIFEFTFNLSFRQDHAGLRIELGFLSFSIGAHVYDVRHLDHETVMWI